MNDIEEYPEGEDRAAAECRARLEALAAAPVVVEEVAPVVASEVADDPAVQASPKGK